MHFFTEFSFTDSKKSPLNTLRHRAEVLSHVAYSQNSGVKIIFNKHYFAAQRGGKSNATASFEDGVGKAKKLSPR